MRWDDPAFGIEWPAGSAGDVRKDKAWPDFTVEHLVDVVADVDVPSLSASSSPEASRTTSLPARSGSPGFGEPKSGNHGESRSRSVISVQTNPGPIAKTAIPCSAVSAASD